MAQWLINPKGKKVLSVRYQSGSTKQDLGDIRVDTPEALVVDWLLKQSIQPWDTIRFQDGRVASLMAPGARA